MGEQAAAHPRVVIVGAGFGGLKLARRLRRAPVRITLVDRNNYHLFQPLLYQVATAGLSPSDIAHPVRKIFQRQGNLRFLLAEATGVDHAGRLLLTSSGPIPYDYLVLAPGGETSYFGNEKLAAQAFGLKALEDAVCIRNHVLHLFELASQTTDPAQRQAWLTFVVVGGGPTGVECAGALSELIRLVLLKDFPELSWRDVRVLLLEARDQLLTMLPPRLGELARVELERKRITVRMGVRVSAFDGRLVDLSDGTRLPACTLIWAAGVRSARWLDRLGLPQDRAGRILVTPTLNVEGRSDLYVIGDAAALAGADGEPLPMVAPVAIQQADTVADNLLRHLAGQAPQPFVYRHPGTMATIGRNHAVAAFGRLNVSGFLAWLIWLSAHIVFLIGFRNRVVVLINWAWDYFFYDRAVRLITPDQRCRLRADGSGACAGGERCGHRF